MRCWMRWLLRHKFNKLIEINLNEFRWWHQLDKINVLYIKDILDKVDNPGRWWPPSLWRTSHWFYRWCNDCWKTMQIWSTTMRDPSLRLGGADRKEWPTWTTTWRSEVVNGHSDPQRRISGEVERKSGWSPFLLRSWPHQLGAMGCQNSTRATSSTSQGDEPDPWGWDGSRPFWGRSWRISTTTMGVWWHLQLRHLRNVSMPEQQRMDPMTARASRSARTVAWSCRRRSSRRLRRWRRRHPKNALTKIETKEERQDALGSGDARAVDTLLLATSTWERVPGQPLPDLRDRHHLCRPHQWGHRRWHQVRLWRQLMRTTRWTGPSIWWDMWWMFNERWDKPFFSTSGTRSTTDAAVRTTSNSTCEISQRQCSETFAIRCLLWTHQRWRLLQGDELPQGDGGKAEERLIEQPTHHRLHQVCSPTTWTRTSRFKRLHDDGATWTSRRWTHNGSLGHRLQ